MQWAAVEIMGVYAYKKPEHFEGLRNHIRRMIAGFELTMLGDSQTVMNAHHFGCIATWRVRHGSKDKDAAKASAHLTEQFVRSCIERPQNGFGLHTIESTLREILTHCCDVAWPIPSNGIIEHRNQIRSFESLLGKTYAEGKSSLGPIFLVPWEALRAWSHRHPDFAPAFLVRIAPVFEEGTALRKR